MNSYLYFGAISLFVAIGFCGSNVLSWLVIPNFSIDVLMFYLLIGSLSGLAGIILFGIGTEIKPTDEDDIRITKNASWPL